MAWAFISFQQLFTPATKRGLQLYETGIIIWSSESKFFRWHILMTAGDTRVADLLDTVHYEMDSVVCGHLPIHTMNLQWQW